jgi:hypothetical protein
VKGLQGVPVCGAWGLCAAWNCAVPISSETVFTVCKMTALVVRRPGGRGRGKKGGRGNRAKERVRKWEREGKGKGGEEIGGTWKKELRDVHFGMKRRVSSEYDHYCKNSSRKM